MTIKLSRLVTTSLLPVFLAACGGYSGSADNSSSAGGTGGPSGGSASSRTADEFFVANIEPRLEFCKTCHVPGGVADTDEGRNFMLSDPSTSEQAYQDFHNSWLALGSDILTHASGEEEHSGGAPWPESGAAYQDMVLMLACFETPDQCGEILGGAGDGSLGGVGDPSASDFPLVQMKTGGRSHAVSFCEGDPVLGIPPKPDSAALPPDPRELLTIGYDNADRAVYFNGYLENCLVGMPEEEHPMRFETCGDYRAQFAEAEEFYRNELAGSSTNAEEWGGQWREWGMAERPDNYDDLAAMEAGAALAPLGSNPYPLEGEDPNAPGVNGGSGTLPVGYVQKQDADGNWTGEIGSNSCRGCHSAQMGLQGEAGAPLGFYGNGGNGSGLNLGGQRGQSDAHTAFELIYFIAQDWDSLAHNPRPGKYKGDKATNRSDTPSWWNTGYRARKFFDGGGSVLGMRIDLSGDTALAGDAREYIEANDHLMQLLIEATPSPAWPSEHQEIDMDLAATGAVLFHSLDLFSRPGNANWPKPDGGNGSCASCHGVYSPRYANDPAYLETPELAGYASHIARPEVIGTDAARLDTLNIEFTDVWDHSWWAYPDSVDGFVPPEQKDPATENADDDQALADAGARPFGVCQWGPNERDMENSAVPYVGWLAPPLHGVWASPPYFHNGSVPTIAGVLDSSRRLPIWQRKLAESPSGKVVFDYSFASGYDFDELGWKVDEIKCEEFGTDPYYGCDAVDSSQPTTLRTVQNEFENNTIGGVGTVTANGNGNPFNELAVVPVEPTQNGDHDASLFHDTRIHSNSNTGHEFSDVLTENELRAILEYLKTL